MRESRREVLAAITAAAAGLVAARSGWSLQMKPSPQPMSSPNAPHNQNAPGGLDNLSARRGEQQQGVNPVLWGEVQKDTDKLFQMVSQFKDQVHQTNLGSTLPLDLLKQGHQIEKLAKQIQERMKNT